MTSLTRQDVLQHQANVPWPMLHQVEQDLLLSRAMVALFSDAFLKEQIAMRGGTVLHKVHLAPPSRYSEDMEPLLRTGLIYDPQAAGALVRDELLMRLPA